MWGQDGVFRLTVDGVPVLCFYLSDSFGQDEFEFYAESLEGGFCSEKGLYHEYDEPALGRTVAEHAEHLIRDALTYEPNTHGKKRPKRKEPLPRPTTVYRMPVDWSEVDGRMLPVAGGAATKKKSRRKNAAAVPAPAEPAPAEAPAATDREQLDQQLAREYPETRPPAEPVLPVVAERDAIDAKGEAEPAVKEPMFTDALDPAPAAASSDDDPLQLPAFLRADQRDATE